MQVGTPYTFMGIKATKLADADSLTREQWLALRKQGIGGSDVATIMGENPWKGVLRLNAERIGLLQAPDDIGEAGTWGTVLESAVAEEWSRRTGNSIRKVRAVLAGSGPENAHAVANLDYICKPEGEDAWGVLEIKTASAFSGDAWGTEENPTYPRHYWWQVQHYMWATGLGYAWLVVLIGGQKMVARRIEKSDEYLAACHWLHNFHNAACVHGRMMLAAEMVPPKAGASDDIDVQKELAPADGPVLELADADLGQKSRLGELLVSYKAAKEQSKLMDEIMESCKAQILAQLVPRGYTGYRDGKKKLVELRTSNRESFDKKAAIAAGLDLTPFTTSAPSKAWYFTP